MLRTPHRPLDQPTILVTVNPSTPAPIPANPATESVYSLVYGLADQPAPLYRSRHAGRVRAAAKQPQGLNASFQRLAIDDSRAASVPKTVPSTNTGLYTTPAGRTGSVKRVPPPRPGEKSTLQHKSSSSLSTRKTPPVISPSSSASLYSLQSARKSAPRVPISHRPPAASKKQTPPTTKSVSQSKNHKSASSGQTAKIAPAVESTSHYREEDPADYSESDLPPRVPDAAVEDAEEEEEILEQLPTQRNPQQHDQEYLPQQGIIRARGPGVARLLTNQERVDILARLKVHWEHLSSAYRRLPISSDSPSKLRRRRDLESELQNVEADIKKFSGSSVTVID
ncbi:hypothetical protein HDU89_000247 [Geranomyces variabilis]|nr:hypothetical protein HDU89_000247 [Geranomyces variabilis]